MNTCLVKAERPCLGSLSVPRRDDAARGESACRQRYRQTPLLKRGTSVAGIGQHMVEPHGFDRYFPCRKRPRASASRLPCRSGRFYRNFPRKAKGRRASSTSSKGKKTPSKLMRKISPSSSVHSGMFQSDSTAPTASAMCWSAGEKMAVGLAGFLSHGTVTVAARPRRQRGKREKGEETVFLSPCLY